MPTYNDRVFKFLVTAILMLPLLEVDVHAAKPAGHYQTMQGFVSGLEARAGADGTRVWAFVSEYAYPTRSDSAHPDLYINMKEIQIQTADLTHVLVLQRAVCANSRVEVSVQVDHILHGVKLLDSVSRANSQGRGSSKVDKLESKTSDAILKAVLRAASCRALQVKPSFSEGDKVLDGVQIQDRISENR